jgi:hypothetical protein
MNMRWTLASLRSGRVLLGLLLALVSMQLHAQAGPITTQTLFFDQATSAREGNYLDAQGGFIYTDNVDFTREPKSDVLAMIGLVGDTARTNAPRLDYHLDTNIAIVKYFSNTYQVQPFGYLDAGGEFKVVPGFFSWDARDSYSQAVLNPFAAATPDNIESLNYATTGPKFILKPTLQDTLTVTGFYGRVDTNSKSPNYINIDSDRWGGEGRVDHAFSSNVTVYVTYDYGDVTYVDKVNNSDFTSQVIAGGLRFHNFRTTFDGSIGYTKLRLNTDDPTVEDKNPAGVNWRFELGRLLTPTQRLTLHASKQNTDAANLFLISLDQPVPSNQNNRIVPGQPFVHTEYGATWHVDGIRNTLDVGLMSSSDRYEVTPQDNRDAKSINALYQRKLTPLWAWNVTASYEDDDYTTGNVHTITLMTTLRWTIGQRVAVRFLYARSELGPHGVAANEIGVTATYALTRAALATDPSRELHPSSPASQPRL